MRELSANKPSAFAFIGIYFETSWERERLAEFRAMSQPSGKPYPVFRRKPAEHDDYKTYSLRLAKWLSSLVRHTAVFAVNDMVASEVTAAAEIAGRRIPQDITLVGVDNLAQYAEAANPPITSVQLDFERAGWLAARLLDDIMRGQRMAPATESYGPLLCVRRESTRGFGRREPHVLSAVEIIRREACDGLTPQALVHRVPGSRRLLELRFREAMGHSILDEIQAVRLEKACMLLSGTNTPIEDIAGLCGFDAGRTLRTLFRARTGMSMREFRNKNSK